MPTCVAHHHYNSLDARPIADCCRRARPSCTQIVDADIREESVELKYMDSHGTERRVGAKTRFADVKAARVLRVSRRVPGVTTAGAVPGSNEKAGLMGRPPSTGRRKKRDGRRSQDLAAIPESPSLPAAETTPEISAVPVDLEAQRGTEAGQATAGVSATAASPAASAQPGAHANEG